MPTLEFKGKQFVHAHHLSVPFRQLEVDKNKSFPKGNASLDDNLIIHGDNLHALKALLPIYAGKVKCIFIDPPYNTGTEGWCYNDNVRGSLIQEWLKKSANPVDKDDLERHDKWLCMMWPRLTILRELLSTDGIIAISIDDNEVFKLGLLMDEIFGESKQLACAPWLSEPSGGKEKTGLRGGHEYILIYHNGDSSNITQEERSTGELNLKDAIGKYRKGRELRKWGGVSLRKDRPGQWYPLYAQDGSQVYPIRNDGEEGHWRWGSKNPKIVEILENPELVHWENRPFDKGVKHKGKTQRWVPYEKIRDKKKSVGWSTWLDSYGFNSDGTREIKEIFGSKIFDTPKPTSLVKWIISLHADDDAIVLDSFAGSGTTGHAVLALNQEDRGNRKFILVECEDYTDKTTAERVRRVIKGVPKAKVETLKEGLGGSFTYCTLGDEVNIESLLKGDNLPDYQALARYVFYTATGKTLEKLAKPKTDYFIGETEVYRVHLIYKPDKDFLRNNKSALNAEMVNRIAASNKSGKRCLVFATAKFMGQRELTETKIDFCQLPYAIHRVLGD